MSKRKIDWPQVAVLAIVAACGTYLVAHLDTEKAEAWVALLPAVAAAVAAFRRPVLEDKHD